MYDYITGEKIKAATGTMVVENGGIGYVFTVSDRCAARFEGEKKVKVYAYLSVKEDGVTLFGFYGEEERAMFLKLISVSGIGPKVAVAILGAISVDKLAGCIVAADAKALNKIKGVGKKTAERIVLELKDKIGADFSGEESAAYEVHLDAGSDDAVMALMALGFTRKEAETKISRIDARGLTVEEVVYAALKNA